MFQIRNFFLSLIIILLFSILISTTALAEIINKNNDNLSLILNFKFNIEFKDIEISKSSASFRVVVNSNSFKELSEVILTLYATSSYFVGAYTGDFDNIGPRYCYSQLKFYKSLSSWTKLSTGIITIKSSTYPINAQITCIALIKTKDRTYEIKAIGSFKYKKIPIYFSFDQTRDNLTISISTDYPGYYHYIELKISSGKILNADSPYCNPIIDTNRNEVVFSLSPTYSNIGTINVKMGHDYKVEIYYDVYISANIPNNHSIGTFVFSNHPPVAKFTYKPTDHKPYAEKTVVTFDATNSYDPDGDPLSYTWEGDIKFLNQQGPIVKGIFKKPEKRSVCLFLSDPFSETISCQEIDVVRFPDLYVEKFEIIPKHPEMNEPYEIKITIRNPAEEPINLTLFCTECPDHKDHTDIGDSGCDYRSVSMEIPAKSSVTFSFKYKHKWNWLGGKSSFIDYMWKLSEEILPMECFPLKWGVNVIKTMLSTIPSKKYHYFIEPSVEVSYVCVRNLPNEIPVIIEVPSTKWFKLIWSIVAGLHGDILIYGGMVGCSLPCFIVGGAFEIAGWLLYRSASDPDFNYTEIVYPEFITIKEVEKISDQSLKDFVNSSLRLYAYVKALNKTFAKYWGARIAGDYKWASKQLITAKIYLENIKLELEKINKTTQKILEKIQSNITYENIKRIKDEISRKGLPEDFINIMKEFGLNDEEINLFTNTLININDDIILRFNQSILDLIQALNNSINELSNSIGPFTVDEFFPRTFKRKIVYLWYDTKYNLSMVKESWKFVNSYTLECNCSLWNKSTYLSINVSKDYLYWMNNETYNLSKPMFIHYLLIPSKFLKSNFTICDEWNSTGKFIGLNYSATTTVLGLEKVTVPAGKFKAVLIKTVINCSDSYISGIRYIWLAKNVGVVKLIYYHSDGSLTYGELVSPNFTIPIGVLVDLSGPSKSYGTKLKEVLEKARDDINNYFRRKSIPYNVTLYIEDTHSDPALALSKIKNIYNKGVRIIIAPITYHEVKNILSFVKSNNIILALPSSIYSHIEPSVGNVFRFSPSNKYLAKAIAEFTKLLKIKAVVVILNISDGWTNDLKDKIINEFRNKNIEVAKVLEFSMESENLTSYVTLLETTVNDLLRHYNHSELAILALIPPDALANLIYAISFNNSNSILLKLAWILCHSSIASSDILLEFSGELNKIRIYTLLFKSVNITSEVKYSLYNEILSQDSLNAYDALWILTLAYVKSVESEIDIPKLIPEIAISYSKGHFEVLPVGGKIEFDTFNDRSSGSYVVYTVTNHRWKAIAAWILDENRIIWTIKGDFNHNYIIDIGDVVYVAYIVVGKEPQNLAADFNHNGRVDIGDLVKIVYYLIGKIYKL